MSRNDGYIHNSNVRAKPAYDSEREWKPLVLKPESVWADIFRRIAEYNAIPSLYGKERMK